MEGALSPLESGKFIMENAKHIQINEDGVLRVARMDGLTGLDPYVLLINQRPGCKGVMTGYHRYYLIFVYWRRKIYEIQIYDAVKDGTMGEVEFSAQAVHPKGKGKSAIDWIFFTDTVNFSFWPDRGTKYDVTYEGTKQTGYFAACAAVNKALDSGLNITSAEWMAKATEADVDKVFKSDGGYSIPLLKERVKAINDSGRVLLEKWDGSFYNCILKANGSAANLLEIIVENFESFRDFAVFCGQKVSFLKRAQILVADVYGALHTDDPACGFKDIGILTMFADYRVPQALAYLGALEYSPELVKLLRSGQLLPNGSVEEVELRGASIWVCERIVSAIQKLRGEESDVARPIHAMDVDLFAWVYRRKHAAEIEKACTEKNEKYW